MANSYVLNFCIFFYFFKSQIRTGKKVIVSTLVEKIVAPESHSTKCKTRRNQRKVPMFKIDFGKRKTKRKVGNLKSDADNVGHIEPSVADLQEDEVQCSEVSDALQQNIAEVAANVRAHHTSMLKSKSSYIYVNCIFIFQDNDGSEPSAERNKGKKIEIKLKKKTRRESYLFRFFGLSHMICYSSRSALESYFLTSN